MLVGNALYHIPSEESQSLQILSTPKMVDLSQESKRLLGLVKDFININLLEFERGYKRRLIHRNFNSYCEHLGVYGLSEGSGKDALMSLIREYCFVVATDSPEKSDLVFVANDDCEDYQRMKKGIEDYLSSNEKPLTYAGYKKFIDNYDECNVYVGASNFRLIVDFMKFPKSTKDAS